MSLGLHSWSMVTNGWVTTTLKASKGRYDDVSTIVDCLDIQHVIDIFSHHDSSGQLRARYESGRCLCLGC